MYSCSQYSKRQMISANLCTLITYLVSNLSLSRTRSRSDSILFNITLDLPTTDSTSNALRILEHSLLCESFNSTTCIGILLFKNTRKYCRNCWKGIDTANPVSSNEFLTFHWNESFPSQLLTLKDRLSDELADVLSLPSDEVWGTVLEYLQYLLTR